MMLKNLRFESCLEACNRQKKNKIRYYKKSMLKSTLACAMLIGCSAFNNLGFAANIDINNNSFFENGINNSSYYASGNTLNIQRTIDVENNLPVISNITNFVISGSENSSLAINGDGLSTIGYTINNSVLTVQNLTFSKFANVSDDINVKGTAFLVGGSLSGAQPSTLTLKNVILSNNSIKNTDSLESQKSYSGGAVFIEGILNSEDTVFENNSISTANGSVKGGAVSNSSGAEFLVNGGNFKSNTAETGESDNASGGAVYNEGTFNSEGADFSANTVSASDGNAGGGAIYNNGTASINGGNISGNSANATGKGNASGGAVYNNNNLSITNATFSGNNAQVSGKGNAQGGAIYNSGSLNIANTTFSDNSVQASDGSNAQGGAIYSTTDIILQGGNTFTAAQSDGLTNDIYLAGGNLIVNNEAQSLNANIISSGLSSFDDKSSIILKDGGELILNGDNTGFKGNAYIGENSLLTYGGTADKSLLNLTEITGSQGGVEFNLADDYNLSAGQIITGSGINDGRFIQSGSGNLILTDGDYSAFQGQVIVNSGTLSYIKDSTDTKYIAATTNTINSNALLDITINGDLQDSIGQLAGSGSLNKNGTGTLNLTGDNSGFEGKLAIQQGTVSYINNENNKYITGSTSISEGAALDVTTNAGTNDSIGQISE